MRLLKQRYFTGSASELKSEKASKSWSYHSRTCELFSLAFEIALCSRSSAGDRVVPAVCRQSKFVCGRICTCNLQCVQWGRAVSAQLLTWGEESRQKTPCSAVGHLCRVSEPCLLPLPGDRSCASGLCLQDGRGLSGVFLEKWNSDGVRQWTAEAQTGCSDGGFKRLLILIGKHHFKLLWLVCFLNHSNNSQQGTHDAPHGCDIPAKQPLLSCTNLYFTHAAGGENKGMDHSESRGLKGFLLVTLQRVWKVINDWSTLVQTVWVPRRINLRFSGHIQKQNDSLLENTLKVPSTRPVHPTSATNQMLFRYVSSED